MRTRQPLLLTTKSAQIGRFFIFMVNGVIQDNVFIRDSTRTLFLTAH